MAVEPKHCLDLIKGKETNGSSYLFE